MKDAFRGVSDRSLLQSKVECEVPLHLSGHGGLGLFPPERLAFGQRRHLLQALLRRVESQRVGILQDDALGESE